MSDLPLIDPELAAKITAGTGRVERIEHAGQIIWVKRPEVLSGKLRLYKGDPDQAFKAERKALIDMSNKGLPVAKLVAYGDDFIAVKDAGKPLKTLLRLKQHPKSVRITMIADAARALAQLHLAGVSHGRPNLKDILWQDGVVRFIDFERASPKRNTPKGHAEDVILFFFSAIAEIEGYHTEIDAAQKAYIAAGGAAFWGIAVKRMSKLGWAYWVSRLAVPFLGKGRDFRAIKRTFNYFKELKVEA